MAISLNQFNYEFIGHLFNFGFPGNDTMFSLIILFSELMFIGMSIIYLLFEVFEIIIDEFGSDYKRIASNFTPKLESFLDIFFLLFPTIVIVYILVPTLGFIYSEDIVSDSKFTLLINVTGHQWYWTYQYYIPDTNGLLELVWSTKTDYEFDAVLLQEVNDYRLLNTDNPVFIPVHTRILIQVTSDDVIHSWAIPQLGIKTDAVPGRIAGFVLYADVIGTWYGQCSELCGAYHSFMPITLTTLSPPAFYSLISLISDTTKINGSEIEASENYEFSKKLKNISNYTDIIAKLEKNIFFDRFVYYNFDMKGSKTRDRIEIEALNFIRLKTMHNHGVERIRATRVARIKLASKNYFKYYDPKAK